MQGEEEIRQAAENAEPEGKVPPDEALHLKLFDFQRNDYGNAQRLLARFPRRLIHVHGKGWYAWDGKRWNGERGEHLAQQLAHTTALAIFAELKAFSDDSRKNGKEEESRDGMRSHRKWAIASGNTARIQNMLTEATPYVQQTLTALDATPYLLNVENCTIDLADGVKKRRHRPEDFITRMAPVTYEPAAGCPTFRAFLNRILPDKEEQEFLQRWLGYCLTGDICEQKLLLCHGEGRNGKSTLLKAIINVFGRGEYAMMIPFESMLQDDRRRGSDATPDIARLPGTRFVAAVEPEQGARISTSMIKRFTGGESITARHLNQGFFEFEPQFKLFLSFNPKPSVPAQDDGTWRRIMMLEFREIIGDAEKDKHLDDKLAAETSGILNWLLDGFRLWREDGLKEPASVREATEEYRVENDAIGRFVNETLVIEQGKELSAKELMAAFKRWCLDNGMKPISQRRLGERMKQLGIQKDDKGPGKTYRYLGIRLASPLPSQDSPGDTGSYWRGDRD